MEGFCFLDSENGEPGGKMNIEILPKKHSFGSVGRKRLSDITNSHSQHQLKPVSFVMKDYIEQLQKENMILRQHLQERNKLLELTGVELTKMRINMQKLQQQNRLLARANNQMTLERNLDKDRIKVLQHEVGCRGSLLAIKEMELEEKVEKKPCHKPCTAKKNEEVTKEAVDDGGDDIKPCKINKRAKSRIQSPGSFIVEEQVEAKESTNRRRQSRRFQSLGSCGAEEKVEVIEDAEDERQEVKEKPEPADGGNGKPCNRRSKAQSLGSSVIKERVTVKEKPEDKRERTCDKSVEEEPDNKRLCVRRQSARHKPEPTEDSFEIEDARFPMSTLPDVAEEVKGGETDLNSDTPTLRTSIGRPVRRAAVKVQSYKEIPVNIKMRRSD